MLRKAIGSGEGNLLLLLCFVDMVLNKLLMVISIDEYIAQPSSENLLSAVGN